jgi:hypothetical protein
MFPRGFLYENSISMKVLENIANSIRWLLENLEMLWASA